MNWDQIRGTWRGLKSRTIGLQGRAFVVALLLLMTMMGCSLLQAGQQSPAQSQQQVPPPSTTSVAGAHPSIVLGTATGAPGQDVALVATLQAAGTQVAGTQNDLTFDAVHVSLAANGKPSCRVNAAIGKGATAFSLRPHGCQGAACTTVRALVLAVDNTDPIPDGATLYTCTLHISPSTPAGQYRISIGGVVLSTPAGQIVPHATGRDGMLVVSAAKK
jgi:hypothetical protein